MGMESARSWLAARGFEDRIREFNVSSATVDLAAQALGVEPGCIAKTLSFYDGDSAMLILAAGNAKIACQTASAVGAACPAILCWSQKIHCCGQPK